MRDRGTAKGARARARRAGGRGGGGGGREEEKIDEEEKVGWERMEVGGGRGGWDGDAM